jgi:lipoyl(octanoyl) transferase
MRDVWVTRCGQIPYDQARQVQFALAAARQEGEVPDVLLLLEHPPVYTRGRRSKEAELPMGEEWYRSQGIEVCETDRGGAVTYHGPGQLVGYPIVSLAAYGNRSEPEAGKEVARMGVVDYVRGIEGVMIDSLAAHGVNAVPGEGLTGVWAGGRKIGSIGVHVSRGVTTHGFAINVNNDLQPFEWIVPCGIEGCRMTSLARELGAEQDMDGFAATVAELFGDAFERRPEPVAAPELTARVPGAEALARASVEAALP